jgi:HEAT repeat protein
VFPALSSKDFNERLAAISCLAFLWSDEGKQRLRTIATSDLDSGVRQSALWAYTFAGGESALELLSSSATNDQDMRVREFASRVLEAGNEFWWLL